MMNCPNCQTLLVPTDRRNVEIDFCPDCRGVWLDRGELDKIIERSRSEEMEDRYRKKDRHDDDDVRYRGKKRGGFLGDLFDF